MAFAAVDSPGRLRRLAWIKPFVGTSDRSGPHCGVEKLVSRKPHKLETTGSSPVSTTMSRSSKTEAAAFLSQETTAPVGRRNDPAGRKAYSRWHYQQNKAVYVARAKANNKKSKVAVRDYILQHLNTHPCVDCDEADPIVLEFDHRPGTLKRFDIGAANCKGYSVASVEEEIAKCDVRCANCHRRMTYSRRKGTNKGVMG